MLSGLRRRIRATRDDAGFSLTEMLIAMGLSTLLGAITLTLFLAVGNSTAATTDRTVNSSQARNVLQSWTAYLRVADGTTPGNAGNRFQVATGTDLVFFADLGNRPTACLTGLTPCPSQATAPTLVWLRLDSAGNLVEEQFTATTPLNAAAPSTCRILASATSASPLFTAYDTGGAKLPAFGSNPASAAGCQRLSLAPAASTASSSVASVAITFTITDTSKTRSQQFSSVATVPSLAGAS